MKGEVDLTRDEFIAESNKIIRDGGIVIVKMTCPKCKERVVGAEPNKLHRQYTCNECGEEFVPTRFGMVVVLGVTPEKVQEMLDAARK